VTTAGTAVMMLDGTVEVTATNEFLKPIVDAARREKLAQRRQITAKQKLQLLPTKQDILVSGLDVGEERYLQAFQKLVMSVPQKRENPETHKMAETLSREIVAAEAGLDDPGMDKKPKTAAPQKAGKLSRINLKSGESYVGFFSIKGPNVEIVTPAGTIKVAVDQIKDIQDMN
jgi:hypothetical protein